MSEKTGWTVRHSERIKGDTSRLQEGDQITASRNDDPKFLTVTRDRSGRDPETILDVQLTGSGDSLSFGRGRGRQHPGSDHFQGEIRGMTLQGLEVLVGTVGYKTTDGPNDDEDVEVFIATKTGNA